MGASLSECCRPNLQFSQGDCCRPVLQSCKHGLGCAAPVRRPVRTEPRQLDWDYASEDRWKYESTEYDGRYSYTEGKAPEFEDVAGEIEDGRQTLEDNPEEYEGLIFQSDMTNWPPNQQKYKLVKRTGCGIQVRPRIGGGFTYLRPVYQALPAEVDFSPDDYTDDVLASYQGRRLGEPIFPGRGQGVADVPGLKLIGEIDPGDVLQGGVGDCWLLTAISCLADFNGGIKALFRKTSWARMPQDEANYYTISLYDLPTWTPVEVVVDERLCTRPGASSELLGTQPSVDGELWACYLEKAVAAHCGGWDKIDGGQPTHGWRLLTGCRDVYTIQQDRGGWACFGAKNANSGEWEELANSPHDGFQGLWPMEWPGIGGGGDEQLDEEELFQRMVMWCESNYIMAAASPGSSNSKQRSGIVDGHAYSILDCVAGVGGTDFDLIKIRNPWGHKEFNNGAWIDGGPGWQENPEVEEALQPENADDGVFWMSREEFFSHFVKVYLCALDMSQFTNRTW